MALRECWIGAKLTHQEREDLRWIAAQDHRSLTLEIVHLVQMRRAELEREIKQREEQA
jgi:hypothetical protein